MKEVWSKVPTQRRQSLLEDLEELADADTLVSFEEVAHLALNDEAGRVRTLAICLLWDAQERKLAPIYLQIIENDPDVEVRATVARGPRDVHLSWRDRRNSGYFIEDDRRWLVEESKQPG